ncbi:MAG: hypothetical protein M3N29_00345 [Chloroflexota bacterium]|nr:hypothetical protein [Chloroflexota bacterium]
MTAVGQVAPARPTTPLELLPDTGSRQRLLLIASCLGYGVGLAAAVLLISIDGGMAYDAYAYWLAGQNVLAGQPLYGATEVDALGAFKYPPLFAQLWAPLTLMPALAFSWLWRLACLLCVRWLAGSWRNVGLWLLVPFTITELSLANVTFPVAVMTVMALRGRAWLAPLAAALKFGPLLVVPYVWLAMPHQRLALVGGCLAALAAAAVSLALDPSAWAMYVGSMFESTGAAMHGAGVIALAPTGAMDFALRLALAIGLTALAIRLRSDRLVFSATVIAVPILAVWRFAPLLVLPRLARSR